MVTNYGEVGEGGGGGGGYKMLGGGSSEVLHLKKVGTKKGFSRRAQQVLR